MPRRKKPPAVAPGGSYGQRKQTEAALQAVPITGPSPVADAGAPVASPPVPQPGPVGAMEAAAAHPPPQGVPLSAPTQRPDEPWTAGIDFGPGPGATPAPVLQNDEVIRMWMPALERLASMPDASPQTRNFVRFLRSNT